MSKKVVLLGDMGTDHHGFPPTPVVAGSPDVLIDGKPVARVGDPLAPHSKPKHPPHPRAIAAGSATVLINGIPAAVTGSAISCGGVTIGSGSVVIGDTHAPAAFSGAAAVPAGPQVAPLHTEQTSQASPESSGVNVSESADQSVAAPESSASGISGLRPGIEQEQGTTEPGYHVVQAPTSKMALLAALYGDASAKPANFDRLNPGLGDQVLPGEMVVLGDPEGLACTQIEADLMALAAQVNAQVRTFDQQDAQFIVKYYDLLEAVTATGSAGLGAGAVMVSRQIESIERTLKDIERLHQDSYRKHGHLNHPEFFEKRRALFKNLDFSLGRLARKGMSLDDDAKLKRALGLSSKSVVHHWKTAGVGDIPGYATHYERLAKGARYARNVGYLGITLDATLSAMNIHEACTTGDDKACQVVAYREGGRLTGSVFGGVVGAGAYSGCVALGITSAGTGGVACVVLVGGIGAAAGSYVGGVGGEGLAEKIREVIHE